MEYVGPVEDEGLLGTYQSRGAFLDAVKDGEFDIMLVGRAEAFGSEASDAAADSAVLRWTRAAGFEPVAGSDRLVTYERAN